MLRMIESDNAIRLTYIIPVYNAGAYLEPCLQSVERQGLAEGSYEVICVDDGSTDGSLVRLEAWAAGGAGRRLLRQSHGGASRARNAGLRAARGTYVWMVDADDLLVPQCAPALLRRMEDERLDVLTFGMQAYDTVSGPEPGTVGNVLHKPRGVVSGRTYLLHAEVEMSCCCVLLRRQVVMEHGVFFMEGITLEDLEYMPHVLLYCRRVASVREVCYYYRRNPNSTSRLRTPDFYEFRIHCWLRVLRRLEAHNRRAGCMDGVMGDKAYMLLLLLWESRMPLAVQMRYVLQFQRCGVFGMLRCRRMIFVRRHKLAALCFRLPVCYRLFLRLAHLTGWYP